MVPRDKHSLDLQDELLSLVCKYMETGLFGELEVRDNELLLQLYAFGDAPEIRHNDRRILQLANGQHATLLECIEGGSAYTGGRGVNVRRKSVIPNKILLGPTAWGSE